MTRLDTSLKGDDGWQPIETVPKDGTAVLIILAGTHPITEKPYEPTVASWVSHWEDEGFDGPWEVDKNLHYEHDKTWAPTHWRPLPEAPKT